MADETNASQFLESSAAQPAEPPADPAPGPAAPLDAAPIGEPQDAPAGAVAAASGATGETGPAESAEAQRGPADPQAQAAVPVSPAGSAGQETAAPPQVPDFAVSAAGQPVANIELLDDVELDVKIELGRTQMYIADVLRLGAGSVVELDKLAGDPVDVYVNERLMARGEVLVLNDNFCVRINDIINPIPEAGDGR